MKLAIVFLLAVIALAQAGVREELQNRAKFEEWIVKHNKQYSDANEKVVRYMNFLKSVQRAEDLQQRAKAKGSSATYGLNKFSDMTPEEFEEKILMKRRSPSNIQKSPETTQHVLQVPSSFDWRAKGMITPVKDQGQCGSCWAFSVTETVESAWMLSHGINGSSMVPLAPQQVVDCDSSDDGCGGGNPPTAYQYIMSAGGLDTNAEYPYTAEDGTCAFKKPVYASMTNWFWATQTRSEDEMRQNMVQKGPLSICLDAANWQDYTGGVLTAWECAWINELDHCVQAVAYDTTGSTPYWLVRNSWGTGWGENGFIQLEYGANTCGMATEASYVTTPN